MLKTKVLSKRQRRLIIEQQDDFTVVLYILKNNENTLSEMKNNLLEVSSPNLRYHRAQNQGYGKKRTDESWN